MAEHRVESKFLGSTATCATSCRNSPNHACTISMHVAFQINFRMAAAGSSSVAASVHLARLPVELPSILLPFAMCWTFSSSDYYGSSVLMRLAPFRASRVSS